MSLDFFDDEFLEIPSIAPDLMFVEQDNPLLQDIQQQQQQKQQQQQQQQQLQQQQQQQQLKNNKHEHKTQQKVDGLSIELCKKEDLQEKQLPDRNEDKQQEQLPPPPTSTPPTSTPQLEELLQDQQHFNLQQQEQQKPTQKPNKQKLQHQQQSKQSNKLKQYKVQKQPPHTIPSQQQDVQHSNDSSSVPEEPLMLTPANRQSLLNLIIDDHSYARPYPTVTAMKESKMTLPSTAMTILKLHPTDLPPKKKYKKRGSNKNKGTTNRDTSDEELDIVTVDKPDDLLVKYDTSRARHVMNEVEAYLNSLWKDVDKDDEEKISRGSWSKEQARLFDAIYKLINNYQLAKLSYAQNTNEPVLRKLALEKATKRVRKAFGSVIWNSKLIVWLHGIMIDGLCSSFFLCYLEILQSLKRKVPSLFERIFLNNKATFEKEQTAGLTNLGSRLRKSWEPAVGLHTKVNMEKFPIVPFLITIPCGPSVPHQSTKRNRFWNYQLMNIGKSVPINTPAYRTPEGYVVKHYLEHCISSVRSKTNEFATRFPDRPVVLLGWDIGSIIALKIALLDKVDAVICLGFSCNHIEGDESEEYWEAFTKIECPVLFILGTHATTNSIQRTEKLREKMKVYTNLIVMESGDELLRLTKSQKRSLGMTQNMIDKLLQDRIYVFLKSVLFKPKSLFTQIQEGPSPKKKKKKFVGLNEKESDRKRKKGGSLKPFSLTSSSENSHFALPPLDVSVPLHPESSYGGQLDGLLTTGSISTPIPVTQMQSETLLHPSSANVSLHTVVSTDFTHSNMHKVGQKRPSTTKEKSVKKRVAKKSATSKTQFATHQNFTASLGTQAAGNLFGQRFPGSDPSKSTNQQTATLQRLPSGTFVLSGASGNVRLQSGANIVYLQQLTSSGGTTKVIQSPLIANANGTFSAVPVVSDGTTFTSTSLVSTSSFINAAIGTKPKTIFFQQSNSVNVVASTTAATNVTAALPNTKPANLILAASLPSFQPKSVDLNVRNSKANMDDDAQQKPVEDTSVKIPSTTSSASSAQPSLKNLMFTIPTSQLASSGGTLSSADANEQTQAILQQLSQEEIKCLANLIGKYSSHPNSPASSPTTRTPDAEKGPSSPNLPMASKADTSSSTVKSGSNGESKKSQLISLLDQNSSTSGNNSLKGVKKVTYPLSLSQKVATIQQQQQDKSRNPPRLKPPRTVSTASSKTTIVSSTSAKMSKQQKVPITITIPLSRLPSNLQLSTTNSKSISVPALSAYLAQQKFVLSTGKPSSLQSRTVLLSPGGVKKSGVTSAITKATSVFAATKSSAGIKSPTSTAARSSATITLHLPVQSALKDSLTLKKAASDIKLVGVLNQKTKTVPMPNVSSSLARTGAFTTSHHKLNSPVDKVKNDLSPVHPRKPEEGGIKGSVMTTIEENAGKSLGKEQSSFDNDESDIDFAVMPSVPKVNKPINTNSSPIISASKIIRVPIGQTGLHKVHSRTVLNVSTATKLSDTPLMNSARKVGAAFQKGTEVKAAMEQLKDSKTDATTSISTTDISKLRFEPLGLAAGSRPKLSSVLSSMRGESTGKIVVDENGQIRNTFIAKPTVVNSKTAAMIARNAFITDTKIMAKSTPTKPSISSTTPALFTLGSIGSSGVISTPAATIRTANKVLPVTIKSSDFIRMSNQVRTNTNVLPKNAVKAVKKETTFKVSDAKAKVGSKKSTVEEAAIETKAKDEPPPPPYITRSGRVLRTRFSYSDELDRKASPRKRRRTNSISKDEATTPTTPMANLGNALDSLVEAAKMITEDSISSGSVTDSSSLVETPVSNAKPPISSQDPLAHIDSTTNLAATAMLELLSSNASVSSSNVSVGNPLVLNAPIEVTPNQNQIQAGATSSQFQPVQQESTQNSSFVEPNVSKEQQPVLSNSTTVEIPEMKTLSNVPVPTADSQTKDFLGQTSQTDNILNTPVDSSLKLNEIADTDTTMISSLDSVAKDKLEKMLSPQELNLSLQENDDGAEDRSKIETRLSVHTDTCNMKEE